MTFERVPREPAPLPCPFCGVPLIVDEDHHGDWWGHRATSQCLVAHIQLVDADDIALWNTRGGRPA